jgi:hypothetical protein
MALEKTKIPPEARKSHWQARMRDILETHFSKSDVAIKYARYLTGGNQLKMQGQINNILAQRTKVETAAEFVTKLESIIKKKGSSTKTTSE